MRSLLYALILLLFTVAVGAASGPQSDLNRIEATARAELDAVVAKQEAQEAKETAKETLLDRQNKFGQFVSDELFNLEFDLREAGKDSIQAAGIVAVVDRYASGLVDSKMNANPEAMTGMFQDMVVTLRRRMRLPVLPELLGVGAVPAQDPVVQPPPVVQAPPAVVAPSVPPPPPAEPATVSKDVVEDVFAAIEAANWVHNVDNVVKDWPKMADQSWQSPDRKVTFAVGYSAPTVNLSLGRLRAESNARVVLAQRCASTASVDVELRGTQPLEYKTARDGTIYCLIAVPTSLLPR